MKFIVKVAGDTKDKFTEEMEFDSLEHLVQWTQEKGWDVAIVSNRSTPTLKVLNLPEYYPEDYDD